MNIANGITSFRLCAAPVFLLVAYLPYWIIGADVAFITTTTVILWILFILMEVSDVLDGMAARKKNVVTAFGKLFDPFADVVARLSYFITFTVFAIMPVWIFALILYRELGMLFFRMVLLKNNVVKAANWFGKTKAVIYTIAAFIGIAQLSHIRFGFKDIIPWGVGVILAEPLPWLSMIAFVLAAFVSWASFLWYLRSEQ